jgi:phytoene dehydrogenase-like protein
MADTFTNLGGTIRYGTTVTGVTVRNGRACGITVRNKTDKDTESCETIETDAVIIAQDTLAAVDRLFDKPLQDPWIQRMRDTTLPVLNTFIALGIEADLSDLPEQIRFIPASPLVYAGRAEKTIAICNYAGYAGYAPEGCTAVTLPLVGDTYDFWKTCRENGTYREEKEKLAKAFIDRLSEQFPQIAGKVAVWDVATPLTYERYLQSYKGSWMTYTRKGDSMRAYPQQTDSISALYFAGQRIMPPGGVPGAIMTGRSAVQLLCRDTDSVFC